MKIAYITGQGFASSSPRLFLSRVFRDSALIPLSPDELSPVHVKDIDLLFLTGVTGEHSPYPDILPPNKAEHLRQWSARTGATIWMDCAASYYAMDLIAYDSPTGIKKERPGLGWVSGIARGPHYLQHHPHEDCDRTPRYCDTLTVPITYQDGDNKRTIEAAYCFSPLLYLDPDEPDNHDIDIMAHFKDVRGEAVALAVKPNGDGNIVISGVLPTIQADDIVFHSNSKHIKSLHDTLSKHRDGHHELLDRLFTRLGIRDYAHL
jgi:glutamine amidotransferase-like uncharacterized protein